MQTALAHPLTRLKRVVQAVTRLTDQGLGEAALLAEAAPLMRGLVERDDWLPEALAQPHPEFYRQYLLHADPLGRFSIVSFVWGPGQQTPVHDHTVWGIIAMLRGAEFSQAYARTADGALAPSGPEHRLEPGQVEMVSPTLGDVHRVRNAFADKVSISIHMYGGNIGEVRRHVFDAATGQAKPFVSGYSNTMVPNLWGPTA
jgi:predicted metal-dependent enzyme (double-stranded beta helix superfamily)